MTFRTVRVLCAREFQNSIDESVHKLLSDQIDAMGVGEEFDIFKYEIRHKLTGSTINFEGLRQNISRLKSYEGVDIVWVEEADKVSKNSWTKLIPTIRKKGSEIWLSFNPDLRTDATYKMFVSEPMYPPTIVRDGVEVPYAVVVRVSYRDNPYFPDDLREDMEIMKRDNFDQYLHVYEGECQQSLEGAIYKDELRAATAEKRICRVPYDSVAPVHTFWDLGRADMTCIWFAQVVGFEYRVIDYYENNHKHIDHFIAKVQNSGYVLGCAWLPHDSKAKLLGAKDSIYKQVELKLPKVGLVPNMLVFHGINKARQVFPRCYFDEVKCELGLEALRHYCYEVKDPETKEFKDKPKHDWASHASDAFRYLALCLGKDGKRPILVDKDQVLAQLAPPKGRFFGEGSRIGWMRK